MTVREVAERLIEAGESRRHLARDPVSLPITHAWLDAMGDENPIYLDEEAARAAGHPGIVTPPAMIQVWTMPGLRGRRDASDPLSVIMAELEAAGYPAIVATDCEQTYHRYLRPGEEVSLSGRLESVVGPKQTALGEGWFVTTRSTWWVGDEPVAEMMFRVLKYRTKPTPPPIMRPVTSQDTDFFWAGAAAGELRVQSCDECGALRHPPGPMCLKCGAEATGYVVVEGTGEVFSFVVHHHPPTPGRTPPYVVALVRLDCGIRMVGEVLDVDPADVKIGDRLEVVWQKIDSDLTLPAWRRS